MPKELTLQDVVRVIDKNAAKSDACFSKVETTLHDVVGAIKDLSRKTDERFAKTDERFAKTDERFAKMDERFAKMDERFAKMDERFDETSEQIDDFATSVDVRFEETNARLGRVEATMVTKNYLDEKLAKLSGNLIEIDRKADKKMDALIGVLRGRKTISADDCSTIAGHGPFYKP